MAATRTRGSWAPRGTDIAVAFGVFGASVVNLATQDEAAGISDIPVAGFIMLAIGSTALLWRRSRSLHVLAVALGMTVVWMALPGECDEPRIG